MTIGFVVFLVLLVLKLTGLIAWSWWWVTAPLWIALAITLVLWAVVGLLFSRLAR